MAEGSNTDDDALKSFVERLFALDSTFAEQKAEHSDSVKDLSAEIKSREEATGVTVKQVKALAKIRLAEQAALDTAEEHEHNLLAYRRIFGFSATTSSAEADDDDALS